MPRKHHHNFIISNEVQKSKSIKVASPNTDQIAGDVKASVVGIAAAQPLVPLLTHVFLQCCTVFECLLTVKAL